MEPILLKSKTRTEVAMEYGISVRTLYRWIRKVKIKISYGLIDPLHLKMIYDNYGDPEDLKR
ncbi:MAG: helix-turn-helix domain-containing protein [Bacteroidota bacterium]